MRQSHNLLCLILLLAHTGILQKQSEARHPSHLCGQFSMLLLALPILRLPYAPLVSSKHLRLLFTRPPIRQPSIASPTWHRIVCCHVPFGKYIPYITCRLSSRHHSSLGSDSPFVSCLPPDGHPCHGMSPGGCVLERATRTNTRHLVTLFAMPLPPRLAFIPESRGFLYSLTTVPALACLCLVALAVCLLFLFLCLFSSANLIILGSRQPEITLADLSYRAS